ncbi:B12-binding domain-containing radical SAM protein [Patescibacteria group bacterium]
MKIAFVQNLMMPYFGISYISSVLRKGGHLSEVFIEGLHKDIVKDICDAQPDIVGFYCITGEHRWVERTAREIKKKLDIPVIVGGPHPTYFPEMVEEDGIDMICRGDGEIAVLELMNRIERKENTNNIEGIWSKEGVDIHKNGVGEMIEDLETLPLPDRDLYDKYDFFKEETEIPVCVSRGCPFNCTFCYNASKKKLYLGKKVVRTRSVENIMSEITYLRKEYPLMKSIIFNDDNLGLSPDWFNEFCEKYAGINGPPYFASIRADFINEKTIKKLKKSNCFCLSLGVESGSAEMRRKILHKNIPDEVYINAAKLMRENGIKVRTSNMFFLPGETIDMAFKTVWLNKKMKTDYPWVYPLQPYPGTEIYDYSMKNNFLRKDFSFDDIDPLGILESPLESKLKDGKKIKVLHRLFYYGVKVPGFVYLLKLFVYIPNNFVFEFFHRFAILMTYANYHQVSFYRALKVALQANKVEKRK